MIDDTNVKKITSEMYIRYGSGSGCLFGLLPEQRSIAEAIIKTTLEIIKDNDQTKHTLSSDEEKINELKHSERKPITTEEKITKLFNNFKTFLISKNKKYGDSALHPINIFSKKSSQYQICNRLDDKLSRIANSNNLRKNDVSDIFGYTALLLIQNCWIEFEDLID